MVEVGTRRKHIQLEVLVFPINISDLHWELAVVFMEDECLRYYDSFPDGSLFHMETRNRVLQYLKDEYKAATDGNELNVGKWDTLDCSSVTPRQMNGESIIKQ